MKEEFNFLDINSIRPIVREVLRYKKSGSVLDLGCGVGRDTLFLAKKGFRVTAVEKNTQALAGLKEIARLKKLRVNVQWKDIATYMPKNKFDMVLSNMVLHFLPNHEQKVQILAMQKHTKKGGMNIVSSYTDKNKKETRPNLIHAGSLKKAYEDARWSILHYREERGKSQPNSSGKIVRYWIEEIMAQKP